MLKVESSSPCNPTKGSTSKKLPFQAQNKRKNRENFTILFILKVLIVKFFIPAILCNFTILNLCLENTAKSIAKKKIRKSEKLNIYFLRNCKEAKKKSKMQKRFPSVANKQILKKYIKYTTINEFQCGINQPLSKVTSERLFCFLRVFSFNECSIDTPIQQ